MLRSRERENVLDEIREPLRFLVDDAERALALLVRPELAVAQQLGEKADLRERRAQLVRHAGNEIDAKLRELLLPPQLNDRGDNQSDCQREQSDQHRQPRARQSADDKLRRDVRCAAKRRAACRPNRSSSVSTTVNSRGTRVSVDR